MKKRDLKIDPFVISFALGLQSICYQTADISNKKATKFLRALLQEDTMHQLVLRQMRYRTLARCEPNH